MSNGFPFGIFSAFPDMTPAAVAEFVTALIEHTAVARPGDTVILEVEAARGEVDELMEQLKPFHEETGVRFLVLDGDARLARTGRGES